MLWEWSPHDAVPAPVKKSRGLAAPLAAMGGHNKWLPVKPEKHVHQNPTVLVPGLRASSLQLGERNAGCLSHPALLMLLLLLLLLV